MTCDIIRQAILTRQPHELVGIGLVETTLDARSGSDSRSGTPVSHACSVDETLVRLSRLDGGQTAVELDYAWGRSDGAVGALLGVFPEHCDQHDAWRGVDAA